MLYIKKKSHVLFCLILLFTFNICFGQNTERKWALAPHIGTNEYKGNLGNDFFTFKQGYGGGFSIIRYISPSFDGVLLYNYDFISKDDDNNLTPITNRLYFEDHIWNVNANLRYKINNGKILKEDSRFAPYIVGGVGTVYAQTKGLGGDLGAFNNTEIDFALFGGLGMKFVVTPSLDLEVQAGLLYPFEDAYDGTMGQVIPADIDNFNDKFLQSHISLVYKFKKIKKKDSDEDGVGDKLDKCPETPKGVEVDEFGCPIDSDLDGIPDYIDDCPQIAGLRLLRGCPDSDGDGVKDELDKCPDTPENLQVTPDGCPLDTDLDGVYDYEDKCPTIPGTIANKGCPEVKKEEVVDDMKDWFAVAGERIYFEYNKSELSNDSKKLLDEIVAILNNHTDLNLRINAYADSRGEIPDNLKLSNERAMVTKDYLIKKGIEPSRISAFGHGESNPVATNMYKWGRYLNRRIEFEIY
ncbi:DUF6089 family protein [Bacteroidota bacterium]